MTHDATPVIDSDGQHEVSDAVEAGQCIVFPRQPSSASGGEEVRGEDIDRPADDCNSGRVGDIILLPLHQLYLDMSNIDIVVKK